MHALDNVALEVTPSLCRRLLAFAVFDTHALPSSCGCRSTFLPFKSAAAREIDEAD